MHQTISYIINPSQKVTVSLIGVGGTGSQVLSSLARIDRGLVALGHPGIHVKAWDPDTVSPANVGRQNYSPADIGMNKAVLSISRINRFYGLEWEAEPQVFAIDERQELRGSNITVSCVDTAKARIAIHEILKQAIKRNDHFYDQHKQFYWLDFGNGKKTGQVVLGCLLPKLKSLMESYQPMPNVAEMFKLSAIKEEDQGPSCSLAEAIGRQDLFINSTLAQLGCNLLWKLFTDGKLDYHGVYLNLETMQTRPIKIGGAA